MAHTLPDLPYSKDALAPVISARTLEFHHGKHHAGYVAKLNAALEGSGHERAPLEDLLVNLSWFPDAKRTAVFNNGAQHYNHSFYWKSMKPGGGAPSGSLARAIDAAFGSLDGLKDAFLKEAGGHFGSGWAWLVKDKGGALKVISTHDADTPIAHGLTPILTADVWEHAYYLDYQNARPTYLEKLWTLLNWDFAAENFG